MDIFVQSYFYNFETKSWLVDKKDPVFALIIGWSMGNYKMLIGDHFLSHTIITMLIAWLIILILEKLLSLKFKDSNLVTS